MQAGWRSWAKFAATRLALVFGGLVLVLVVFVLIAENSFIYFPERYPAGTWDAGAIGLPVEDVALTAADGVKLHAWHLPTEGAAWTVLYLHGNAGNITNRIPMLHFFAKVPASVLLLSYRGYGKSEGEPSEEGLYADARAAYDWLASRVPPRRIALFGESIGGAVAIELAGRVEVGALITQSAFTSIKDMTGQVIPLLPVHWVMRHRYDNLAKVPGLTAPKLFVHGRADEIVPFEQGERLFAAAAEPKASYFVDGAGHNDVFDVGGDAYRRRIAAFLDEAGR